MPLLRYLGAAKGIHPWFPSLLMSVIGSVGLYLVTWKNLDETSDRFVNDGKGDIFDFIIVGAGSAGALVAKRLSQYYSVLLLEAGGEPHPLQLIPSFSLVMLNYPEIDWQHRTVPQKHGFFAQNHQECLLSAGKGLGGTSNINLMIQNRGSPKDYNNWAEILGDPSWSYEEVLPYFKKSECFIGKYGAGGPDDLHGAGGEITVQKPDYVGMGDLYLKAAEEMGYSVTDLNGRNTQGFDYIYYNTRNGRRVSAHSAFLHPNRSPKTLTIRKYAEVTRILFKENTTEAFGVEYYRHGQKKQALATREVILSAGAINSPKLLLLSGIGPKDQLESVGIETLKDLPQVGRNLQDHTAVYLGPFFINGSHSLGLFDFRLQNFFDFLTKGAGPFGSTSALSQGFISSSVAKSQGEGDWPDVQLVLSGASICKDCIPYLAHSFNFQQDLMEIYYENAKGKPSFTQIVSNARPLSRGDIRLRSSNPRMAPIIDPNYLDNEHDIRVMVDGIKKALELVENSTTFQKIGTHFTNESFPGCHLEEFRSDKYWECFVRQFTVSLHHVVGTCSMGKSEEAGGVVDSKLRVFGTKRLRVIDASVMPVLPIGNTNWPVTMIGEKGSQMILDFWNSAVESSSVDNANMGENEIGNEKMPSKLRSDLIIQVPDQADPDMPESDRDTVVESTSIRSSVPNSTFEADYDQELSTMAAMIYP